MNKKGKRKIIVSVTNDLITDNRVHKVCTTLTAMGFQVLLTGRRLKHSLPLRPAVYVTKRMKLLFAKGPLFYAEYNFRLLLTLLFNRFDVLLSNDLDTLPANFLASRLKRKPLVYDSHEYFTEVPELINRPFIKKIWSQTEKMIVPRVNAAYTVCSSIANIYTNKYSIDFKIVRNLPYRAASTPEKAATGQKHIIYQGALNVNRGLENLILSMKYLENVSLWLVGDGDIKRQLEQLVADNQLTSRVLFKGKLPFYQLSEITAGASLGVSAEEDAGLNYRYALPNKLFDYIQARIPVMVSNLPEMAAIVAQYDIGLVCTDNTPVGMARCIQKAVNDTSLIEKWRQNLEVAANELVWENEEHVIHEIFRPFLQ